MYIRVKIRKHAILKAQTKNELMSKIIQSVGSGWDTFSPAGRYMSGLRDNHRYVYTLEKFRAKRSADHKQEIRKPHWIAHVYRVPANLPVKVYQKARTFTIEDM